MKIDLKKLGTTLLIIYAVFITLSFMGSPSTESYKACQDMGMELDAMLITVSEAYVGFDEAITDLVDGNISEDKFVTLYGEFATSYEDVSEKYKEAIDKYNKLCFELE